MMVNDELSVAHSAILFIREKLGPDGVLEFHRTYATEPERYCTDECRHSRGDEAKL